MRKEWQPIHLNAVSGFTLQAWGPHGAQQKNPAAVQQKFEPNSTFAGTQLDVTLCWPFSYLQAHIPGRLLCNVSAVFDWLLCNRQDERQISCRCENFPEL